MADQHDDQYLQGYGYHNRQPPNQLQLLPAQATYPPGEAQNYYDQNESFKSNSYDEYDDEDHDGKPIEDHGHDNSSNPERPKEHHRKRRSHGSSRSSSSGYYKPGLSIDQSAANVPLPTLKSGVTGTLNGLYDLARKKPYVHGDTVERLELLRRADRFFNSAFVGRFGRLNKEKTAWFREDMDRVSRVLRNSPSGDVEDSVREGELKERRQVGYEMPSKDDGRSSGIRPSSEAESSVSSRSSPGIRSSK